LGVLAVRKLYQSFAVLSVCLLCGAGPAYAQGGGYTGGGVLAPAPAPNTPKEEPPGYRGLIPGRVDPAPEAQQPLPEQAQTPPRRPAPEAPTPQMSYVPDGAAPAAPNMSYAPGTAPTRMMTADELKRIAAAAGVQLRLDLVPAELVKNIHIPSRVYSLLSSPQYRIDGMLPTEFAIKRQIDVTMERIRGMRDPEARRQAVGEAIRTLTNAKQGMRMSGEVPDVIFESMGAPAVYVQESREASANSLQRLAEALDQLRRMQQ
jgi:hypothetical protein